MYRFLKKNVPFSIRVSHSEITALKGKLSEVDVLIGMDIINRGDFIIGNCDGKTTFLFRMPSIGIQC